MHVAKRNVILLYFSKLQIQYATNFYMNLFHIIDTYTKINYFYRINILIFTSAYSIILNNLFFII